jgi:hypothetical protein
MHETGIIHRQGLGGYKRADSNVYALHTWSSPTLGSWQTNDFLASVVSSGVAIDYHR